MSNLSIHPDFRLNNKKLTDISELLAFVKQNFPEHFTFIESLFDKHNDILVRTSGSTGNPKTIKIKKDFFINSARKTIDFFELLPGTKALLNLSPEYIAGKLMWIRALIGGWQLDIINPDHHSIEKQLTKKSYDFGAMVPLQVQKNLNLISNISKLIIGGAPVATLLQKQLNPLPNSIFATYGMTETLTHIAVKPLNKTALKGFYSQKEQEGSYRLLSGISISQDKRGCLLIDAPDVSEVLVVTNDIVKIIDNQHFKWLGRYDNIINSGGVKFIPEQIENKLKKHIKQEFFIAGLPDDKLGQRIVLFVEGNIEKQKLSKLFEQYLDRYEKPKMIIEIPKFFRTDSGKIQRLKIINSFKDC